MKKYLRKNDLFPLLLLLLSFGIYGLFIPFLGCYWDDFPYLWFRHTTGVSGVMQALALDRPLLAAFYSLPMSLLGENILAWQIAAVIGRWLFTWCVYLLLKNLWPRNKNEMKLIALLVLVYPGFKQQWISVIYTHVFIVLALYFFSLVLFVKSVRAREKFSLRMAAAILLSVLCMTAVEYTAGLELLRPFIIYKLLAEDDSRSSFKERLGQTLKVWLPYLLPFILFLVYRVFIASSVLYKFQQMDTLSSNPLATLWALVRQQFKNVYTSTVPVWAQVVEPFASFDPATLFSKLYAGMLILLFIACFIYTYKKYPPTDSKSSWLPEAVIGAFLSLLAAGLPFWAANLSPGVRFPNDRILLPFMLGSSMLVFALLFLLSRFKVVFHLLFSLVFALSAAFQVYQANEFRNDWDDLKQFIQQVSWRIPSLEEGTLLVAKDLPLEFYSDNSLTAVFNWVYGEENGQMKEDGKYELPYLINFTESRLGHSLPALEAGTAVKHTLRTFNFQGSTDQMILFYHQKPGCVHIVDPDLDAYNPLLPAVIREYAPASRDDLISADIEQNSAFFLSEEAQNSWCYHYQKASLAAELEEWEQVVEIANTAFSIDDHSNDASEWFPFIEAYARTADWNKALQLSRFTAQVSDLYQPMLCQLWQNIADEVSDSADKSAALQQISTEIGCEINQ
jgi:hypothetical protein